MLYFDTRISPPDQKWILSMKAEGHRVVHVPALECIPIFTAVNLDGFDAAFVASPRAAKLARISLMKFSGKVWAVGKGTARTLIDDNIVVEFSGDGSGAAVFFAKIAGECGGTFPVHKLAWISAEETAENRDNLSRLYGCEITHFPVYKTVDAHPDWDVIDTLPGPRTWLFYSAKAFRSFEAHIATADIVELHGGSAARAGADILNAVIRTIENE